jgi:hypothetical protein
VVVARRLASGFRTGADAMYLLLTFGMPIREGDMLDSMLAFLVTGYWIIMIGLLYANYKTRERILRLEAERGR